MTASQRSSSSLVEKVGTTAPDGRGPTWDFRAARSADLDRVAEIERASFSSPWSRDSFRSLLGRQEVQFLVVESVAAERGPVLGYCVYWTVADEAELGNLAVAREARGRGVGSALLDEVIGRVRREGVRSLFLEVRDSNGPALALYGGRGFREVGVREHYYSHPREDARVLRYDL